MKAGGLILGVGLGVSAPAVVAQSVDGALVACVASYYVAQTLAGRCDLGWVQEPACVNVHLITFDSDDNEPFLAHEDAIRNWREAFAAERGISETGPEAEVCPVAKREIEEQTVIGKHLETAVQ